MAKPLKIDLLVNDKMQTFTEKFVPASRILEALDLIEKDNSNRKLRDVFTERVDFLAKVFTDQKVTADAIWEGFNALDFDQVTFDLVCQVAGVDPKKLQTQLIPE